MTAPDPYILEIVPARCLDALFTAVRLRMEGTRLFGRVRFVQPRTAFALAHAQRIAESVVDYDEQVAFFHELGGERLTVAGRPQALAQRLDPRVVQTVRETLALCDGLAVTSWHEHTRVEQSFGVTIEPCFVDAAPDVPIPRVDRLAGRSTVVVWAPFVRAADLTLAAHALEELHAPVFVVCAPGGKKPRLRAEFVDVRDAAACLARAGVIVDASLEHPGNALELAKLGIPLVVSLSTGAYERLDDVTVFVPWERDDVLRAVQSAIGGPPPRARSMPSAVAQPWRVEPDVLDGSLVSIVVRTYNRPDYLERALRSIARQTYENVEAVVVSDGGVDVADVVARFERARLIVHETNRGAIPSANTGLRESRGEFVGLLDDDDVLFPDHVGTLVAALRRSGSDIAHADTISAFYDTSVDEKTPYGYSLFLNKLGEPTELYLGDGIGPMAALFRRSIALACGGYDETLEHAEDWDFWIRLAARCDFVHVRRVTSMYSIRNDDTNMMSYNSAGFARTVQRLTEKFPLEDRKPLADIRTRINDGFVASGAQVRFPPPAFERRQG